MSETETKPEPQPEFIIEKFTCGPEVRLNGAATWLASMAAEGYELVTAYGVPHPTGNMVMHYYVMRKRVEPQPLVISEEAGREMLAALTRASSSPGRLEPPTTGNGVKPPEAPKGRGRR